MTCVLVTQGIKVDTTCLSMPLILLDQINFPCLQTQVGTCFLSSHKLHQDKPFIYSSPLPAIPCDVITQNAYL